LRFNKERFTMRHSDVWKFINTLEFRKIKLEDLTLNEKRFLKQELSKYSDLLENELINFHYYYDKKINGWLPDLNYKFDESRVHWRLQRRHFLASQATRMLDRKKRGQKKKDLTRFRFINEKS